MKRKRNSKSFGTKKGKRQADEEEEIEGIGTCILDLPASLLTDVVLRLPIKSIVMCKSVCKPWRRVISAPRFAKVHFARAEPRPLVRTLGGSRVSRMLYLIEPSEIDVKNTYNSDNYLSPDSGRANMKLDTRLKIPLRNAEMVMQHNGSDTKLRPCSSAGKRGGFRKRCLKTRKSEQKFPMVNSCNGFLCLSDPVRNNPLVVCNPITGEYLNLPRTDDSDKSAKDKVCCGFGFSEESNQYKVVRMFDLEHCEFTTCPITGKEILVSMVAEVHTLGTGSWRGTGHARIRGTKLYFLTYLNGSLHWFDDPHMQFDYIYSFDFGKEKFTSVRPPQLLQGIRSWHDRRNMTLGVLRDRLCLCFGSVFEKIQIWILAKYGDPKTWMKMKSIPFSVVDVRWPNGSYLPISFHKKKGVLMFQSPKSVFFLHEMSKWGRWKYLKICEVKAKYEAVAHIPSFVSLKDVFKGDHVEIFNINSR